VTSAFVRTRTFRDLVVVLVLVFGVGSIAMLLAHVSPLVGFGALFDGAFGTKEEFAETLVQATNLLFPALGIAIANLINLFNFPLYLLSGGPLPAWDLFAPTMFNEIKKRAFTFERTKTRVERAVLGGDAGLYGAAYLPLQHLQSGAVSVRL